jgi:hypothetical protein
LHHAAKRWNTIHDKHLFPDGKTCDRMAEGRGWMFPIFLLLPLLREK